MTELPKQNSIVLNHQYWKGSFRDFSGNNNHGTPTGVHFEKKPDKHVKFSGTDLITVADSSELQLTTGTIIVYGDFNAYTDEDRLISKRDAGGTNYELYLSSSTNMAFYDGTNTRAVTLNHNGAKSIACSFVNGSTPKGYKDGAFVADFNGACAVSVDDAPLIIGSYSGGTKPNTNPFKGILIYNTVLTDEEIAQIHEWIMQTKSPKKQKKNFKYPSQIPQGTDTSYGIQLMIDGDMEDTGDPTLIWGVGQNATLTKETGTRTGGSGVQVLKVAYTDLASPYARQTVLTSGKKYRVTGWTRSDGTVLPKVRDGTNDLNWNGTSSTDWQHFDETWTAGHSWMIFQATTGSAGYVEFDDVVLQEVNETIAAWDMKNVHSKIIDKTGNGNDATITELSQTQDGLAFYEKGYANIATSPLSANVDFSFEGAITPETSGNTNVVLSNGFGNGLAIMLLVDSGDDLQFQVEKTSDSTYRRAKEPIAAQIGKQVHIMGTYDASGQVVELYVNNIAVTTKISTAYADASAGTALTFGARNNDYAVPYLGTIKHMRLFNSILTATQRAKYYNDFAKQPVLLDDLKDANESIAAEGGAVGTQLSNTDWKFGDTSARYKVSRDSIDDMVGGDEKLTDGNMEDTGDPTLIWTVENSATLTKDTTDPYSGNQCLRVTYNAATNPAASQSILTASKTYRAIGWARGDGVAYPRIYNGAVGIIWTGTTSTDWQRFDIVFTQPSGTKIYLFGITSSASYVEFDDVIIRELDNHDKVIECTTAGMLYQETQQAYGTWEFSILKGGDTTYPHVVLVAGQIAWTTGVGYRLDFSSTEFISLVKLGTGSLMQTVVSYADAATWYDFRVTRRYDGQFTTYIKGEAFTDWTLVVADTGSNPVTDNTTTTSKYICLDLDAGDKISNFKFTEGVVAP